MLKEKNNLYMKIFNIYTSVFDIDINDLNFLYWKYKKNKEESFINIFILFLILKIILFSEYQWWKLDKDEYIKLDNLFKKINKVNFLNNEIKDDYFIELEEKLNKLKKNEALFKSIKWIFNKTFNIINNIYKSNIYKENWDKTFLNILNFKLTSHILFTEPKFLNFKYEWNKKDETTNFYMQLYWLDYNYYLNNFSFSLRSKKNNRPILINWWVVNTAWLKWLEKNLKIFLYWKLPYWKKQSLIASQIMKMVFLWKDAELKNQENLLQKIYELWKNNVYQIEINNIYSNKFILQNLLELYWKDFEKSWITYNEQLKIFQELIKDKNSILNEKINELKNLNIYVVWSYDYAIEIKDYIKKIFWTENVSLKWKSFIFKNLLTYFEDFSFYREKIQKNFKDNWLTKIYNFDVKIESELIWELLKKIKELNEKKFKSYVKFLRDWFNFEFNEYVLNSYLTQVDLSNSLELLQDTFQKYMQLNWIKFDDVEITKINADIMRIKKEEKNKINLKNISLFSLEKK